MIKYLVFTEHGIAEIADGFVTTAFSNELVGMPDTEFFELLDRQVVDYVSARIVDDDLDEIEF